MASHAAAQFYPTPDNPCPQGGIAYFLEQSPGTRIRIGYWPVGTRGTVFVLPGRTEYIEKYFETVGELAARGFSVAVIDWRGQGASTRTLPDRLKGHVGDFGEYLADFAAVIGLLEAAAPKPRFFLAHSMGANIALRALHEWPGFAKAALLTAPMLGLAQPEIAAGFFAGISSAEAYVGRTYDPYKERFEGNPVTRDQKRFARNLGIINAHKELALGAPTGGWLKAALASMRALRAPGYLEKLEVSVVIMTAGREQIVSNSAQAKAAARLSHGRQIVVRDGYHELLQERDAIRTQVWRAFDTLVA
jgi:lysophospholipase